MCRLKSVFSKFYGKVGVIFWLLFHLIWKNYVLYWDFDSKSWIVAFFTHKKIPQNNFSNQNFSVENNYLLPQITFKIQNSLETKLKLLNRCFKLKLMGWEQSTVGKKKESSAKNNFTYKSSWNVLPHILSEATFKFFEIFRHSFCRLL